MFISSSDEMEQHLFHFCVCHVWACQCALEKQFLDQQYVQYSFLCIFLLQSCLFCKGLTFFNQIVPPAEDFHVTLENLLQSVPYLLFSPVFLSLQQVSTFLQHYLQLEVLPISDTWRVHSLGLMRVNTSLPRFPTDPPLFSATEKYLNNNAVLWDF